MHFRAVVVALKLSKDLIVTFSSLKLVINSIEFQESYSTYVDIITTWTSLTLRIKKKRKKRGEKRKKDYSKRRCIRR